MGRTIRFILAVFLAIFAAAAWAALAAPAEAEDILIVYHTGFPPEAHTRAQARDAFLGEGGAWGGLEVRPGVYMDTDPSQAHFVTTVLGMTPEAFDSLWAARIVREGRPAPKRLQSPQAMLDYVATTPGAVGYVRRADAAAVAAYGNRLDVLPWTPLRDSGD